MFPFDVVLPFTTSPSPGLAPSASPEVFTPTLIMMLIILVLVSIVIVVVLMLVRRRSGGRRS